MEVGMFVRAVRLAPLALGVMMAVSPAKAELLTEVLPDLLQSDEEILAAEAEVESAKHHIREEQAAWYPKMDLTLSAGNEQQIKPDSADTDTGRQEHKLAITQLVTDFGATGAAIDKAQLSYDKKEADLNAKVQAVTLDAISAYLGVMTVAEKLRYAQQYEGNIKQQTGMEEARVAIGSGFSTDVLQSKSKLASAYAKTARAQGALSKAVNEYRNVIGYAPREAKSFRKPQMPLASLPRSVDEALQIALAGNPQIVAASYDVQIAKQDLKTAETKFYPKVEFKVDAKHKRNDGGTMGNKEETKYALELSYPLSSGGKDTAGLRKAHADLRAKEEKLDNTRKEVEEKVRNAWQDLLTDKMNAEHLRNSANISAEFLVLARKERKMGTRSLIDVLSEENNYLTSLESAVQAEKDYMVSAFTVLKEIGRLNVSMVQETAAPNAMQKSSYQKSDERTVAAVQKDLGEKLAKQAESMTAIAVTTEETPLPLAQKHQPESSESAAAVGQVSALPTSVAKQETESSNAADPWEAVYEKVVANGWAESVTEVRESVAN
jgi:TolC family type I secretion outer membrane protein